MLRGKLRITQVDLSEKTGDDLLGKINKNSEDLEIVLGYLGILEEERNAPLLKKLWWFLNSRLW